MWCMRTVIFLLAVVAGFSASGQNTPNPADSPDQAAARAAVHEFADLLIKDDLSALKSAFAGNEEAWKFIETLHQSLKTQERFDNIARKLFPDEFARTPHSTEMSPARIKHRADSGAVDVETDSATIGGDDGMHLAKVNGQWKVSDMLGSPIGKAMLISLLPKTSIATEDVCNEAEAGAFKSMVEMQKATNAKVKAMLSGAKPATTKPTSQPRTDK